MGSTSGVCGMESGLLHRGQQAAAVGIGPVNKRRGSGNPLSGSGRRIQPSSKCGNNVH